MAQAKVKARKKPTSKAKPPKTASTLKQEVTRSDYTSLKPDQRLFIDKYIDPQADTFGNGTRAMHEAKNGRITIESARAQAARLLAKGNVRNAIEEVMSLKGAPEDVRLDFLAKAATGQYLKQVKQTYRDSDGKITSTIEVESTPSVADLVRVNNVIWRATGKYDINKAKADVLSARTKQLMKQFKPKQSADSKA